MATKTIFETIEKDLRVDMFLDSQNFEVEVEIDQIDEKTAISVLKGGSITFLLDHEDLLQILTRIIEVFSQKGDPK